MEVTSIIHAFLKKEYQPAADSGHSALVSKFELEKMDLGFEGA